jgi:hypothetical protein
MSLAQSKQIIFLLLLAAIVLSLLILGVVSHLNIPGLWHTITHLTSFSPDSWNRYGP